MPTGLGAALAVLGDVEKFGRYSPGPDMDGGKVGHPAEIVESGTTACGSTGITEAGNESIGGIWDSGTDWVLLGITGELPRDEAISDKFPETTIGTGWWWE